jgi:hypothetical protein
VTRPSRWGLLSRKVWTHLLILTALLACHAASAALHSSSESVETKDFLARLQDMTVCVLSVDDGDELMFVANALRREGVSHYLWVEKPEMIHTALATAPVYKDDVFSVLGHLKLLR